MQETPQSHKREPVVLNFDDEDDRGPSSLGQDDFGNRFKRDVPGGISNKSNKVNLIFDQLIEFFIAIIRTVLVLSLLCNEFLPPLVCIIMHYYSAIVSVCPSLLILHFTHCLAASILYSSMHILMHAAKKKNRRVLNCYILIGKGGGKK